MHTLQHTRRWIFGLLILVILLNHNLRGASAAANNVANAQTDTYTYALVTDEAISVELPTQWVDTTSEDWLDKDNQVIGKRFSAAPDLDKYNTSWATPGVTISTMTQINQKININDVLDRFDLAKVCTYGKRIKHTHTAHGHKYTGAYDLWGNCDDQESNTFTYLVAQSAAYDQVVLIGFKAISDADREAWDKVLASFFIDQNEPTPTSPAKRTPKPRPTETPTAEPTDTSTEEPPTETPTEEPPTETPTVKPTEEPPTSEVQTESPTTTPTALLPASSNPILVEDFHEDKLNPALWGIQNKGSGVQLAIARQRLEITHSADAADDPATNMFGAEVTSVCALTGDFDLQVDYTLLAWPPDNGVRLGLIVKPDSQHSLAIERFDKLDNGEADGYVVDFNGVAGYTPTTDAKGKLRLTRTNTTLTGYFYQNGHWVALHSSPGSAGDLHIALGSWSHNNYFGHETVHIAFDNLIIQSGALACPQADSQTNTANQPTPQPNETPTPNTNPVAVVKVNDLIIRSGPSTNYPLVAHAHQGDQLPVIGQVKNCAWLKVNLPISKETWVTGDANYVDFQGSCSNIPVAKPLPPPTPRPASKKQGCLLFQNNLNAELTVTFTSKDGKWNKTFKVARKSSHQECFAPGTYTYTLDAPPPWGSINGRIDIAPGSYQRFPVNAAG